MVETLQRDVENIWKELVVVVVVAARFVTHPNQMSQQVPTTTTPTIHNHWYEQSLNTVRHLVLQKTINNMSVAKAIH